VHKMIVAATSSRLDEASAPWNPAMPASILADDGGAA